MLAGKCGDIYDGRQPLEVRRRGLATTYNVFDIDPRVTHIAFTESKGLGEVLSWIKPQQDDVRPAPKIKTNSEQAGYKKRDRNRASRGIS
ncbi:hypothetical protein [Oryzicola mucosus]|uniref:Uncharacterized protein n=1 Tax=Oryzicola mucosus TaxID=2767425 RepID=A0A8J6PPL4_9HYPH|nr:hypothetical protein [Oryzicola mucosus]MBD0417516.1 hypothetical protein [Oryzicola mucosus]